MDGFFDLRLGKSEEVLKQFPDNLDSLSELHVGRIGEHLAAADIMMRGHECFHSAQGMPYDLVADVKGRLVKIQVKTTRKTRPVANRATHTPAYFFWVSRCGKKGIKKYADSQVDVFALVCLEEKSVGYIKSENMPKTLVVRAEKNRGNYQDEVIRKRNKPIIDAIREGNKSYTQISRECGLHVSYVHRLRERGSVGQYIRDLTFEKALSND